MIAIFNFYSILLILITVIFYGFGVRGVTGLELSLYCFQLFLFFVVFQKQCSRPIQYMRPFFILLLSCTIVNFQGIIDHDLLGYSNFFDEFKLERFTDKCLYLAVIGQTSLTLGYINYNPRFSKRRINESFLNSKVLSILLIIAFCLFILFIDVKAFMIGDASKVNNGSAEREVGTFSLYSEVLLTAIIIIYISTNAFRLRCLNKKIGIKDYIHSYGIPFWIVYLAYLFLRLLSGDRGPVIYNLAILYFGYVYVSGFRLSLKGTLVLLFIGALAITLMGIARQQSTTLSFIDKVSTASTTFQDSENNSILPVTSELAGSGKIAAIAINGTEEKKSLHYGYGQYEICTIVLKIPFLSRLILSIFPKAKLTDLSTSELFTREVLGANYTYGLGTSAIGESYLDLYIFGPILVFFLFGMLYKRADICILNRKLVSPYMLTLLMYMSGYAIYVGRSSFAFVLSGAIMTVIIQYVIGTISLKK